MTAGVRCFLSVFSLYFVLLAPAFGAEPWDAPFSSDTRAIQQSARAIPVGDDQPVAILLQEYLFKIDNAGRTTTTERLVFRIVKPDAVEGWATVEKAYAPWHQRRPEIRARVISETSEARWLDPRTIADAPAQEVDASIFSDQRVVRAPLPAVAVGAVVEWEVITRETAPILDAGVTRRIGVLDELGSQRFHLSIEAPRNINVQTAFGLVPTTAVRRQTMSQGNRIDVELGPLAARTNFQADLPFDVPDRPYVSFSTGRSWQEVAARYETIVERQLQSPALGRVMEGIDLTGPVKDVAARLTARLHSEVRYTGVEFGEAAIVPRTPAEVLERKYGDCKDKAALLVAMLRAAGLKAHLALLAAGVDTDIDPGLPGMGVFNHAIVYVADANTPLWIDATVPEARVGTLPILDQGRWALVASRESTMVVKTPESTSSENKVVTTVDLQLPDLGPANLNLTIEAEGAIEMALRQTLNGDDPGQLRATLEETAKTNFAAKSLGRFEAPARDDFRPYRLTFEAQQSRMGGTAEDDAAAVVQPQSVLEYIPLSLRLAVLLDGADAVQAREQDFYFSLPHHAEVRYRITVPRLFKPNQLPASEEIRVGDAVYSRTYTIADGVVEVVFGFDSGTRRKTAAEYEQLRAAVKQLATTPPAVVTFVSAAAEQLALGNTREAMELVRSDAASNLSSAGSHVRLSRLMVSVGAVESGIAAANKAVEIDPAFSPGWHALGFAYQHDSFGRYLRGDWNSAEAEHALREALRVDPENADAHLELAILLEHDAEGRRYSESSRMNDAITEYRALLNKSDTAQVRTNLVHALIRTGEHAQAREELNKLPETQNRTVLSAVIRALTGGAGSAALEVQTSFADNRTRAGVLMQASSTVGQLRRYDLAAELAAAAGRLSSEFSAGADVVRRARAWEETLAPATDPRLPVQKLFVEFLKPNFNVEFVKPLFSKRQDWTRPDDPLQAIMREVLQGRPQISAVGATTDLMTDLVLILMTLAVDGSDADGYAITLRGLPALTGAYVVLEDGEYRILGLSSNPTAIAEIVLEFLSQGDLRSARLWLDRVAKELRTGDGFSEDGPAARLLWSGVVEETRGRRQAELAAAAMLGKYAGSQRAVAILESALRTADRIERRQINLALCEAYETAGRWADLITAARRLIAEDLLAHSGFRFLSVALTKLQRWQDLQTEGAAWLRRYPDNAQGLQAMVAALAAAGNREEALSYLDRYASARFSVPDNVFELRYRAILGDVDEALLTAQEPNGRRNFNADYYYTMGMLHALLRRPADAQQFLVNGINADTAASLDATPWVLHAKILELYELPEAAIAQEKARSASRTSTLAEWSLSVELPR